jgi:hypothetical protein
MMDVVNVTGLVVVAGLSYVLGNFLWLQITKRRRRQ